MRKSVRFALLCAILMVASFAPASTLPIARAAGPTFSVEISMAPTKVVCIGESVPILVTFQSGSSIDDRSKHVPIKGGMLVTRAMVGKLDQPTIPVKMAPGGEVLTYTAKSFGDEQLQSSLTSRGKRWRPLIPFSSMSGSANTS